MRIAGNRSDLGDAFYIGIVSIRQTSLIPSRPPWETGSGAPRPPCLAADRLPEGRTPRPLRTSWSLNSFHYLAGDTLLAVSGRLRCIFRGATPHGHRTLRGHSRGVWVRRRGRQLAGERIVPFGRPDSHAAPDPRPAGAAAVAGTGRPGNRPVQGRGRRQQGRLPDRGHAHLQGVRHLAGRPAGRRGGRKGTLKRSARRGETLARGSVHGPAAGTAAGRHAGRLRGV